MTPTEDPLRDRIVQAAVAEFGSIGIGRASMDRIAKLAGVGRATIYRRFEDKDALVYAVMELKVSEALAQLNAVFEDARPLRESLIEGFVVMLRSFREDLLIGQLLADEPEVLVPWMGFKGANILQLSREVLAAALSERRAELPQAHDVRVLAEMAVRIMHSLYLTPSDLIAQDDEAARHFARRYLAELLLGPGPDQREA